MRANTGQTHRTPIDQNATYNGDTHGIKGSSVNKREFLKRLLIAPLLAGFGVATKSEAAVPRRKLLLQQSPINGLQYYRAKDLIYLLQPGDAIRLSREPNNPYDRQAVALYWHGDKLGYLPRVENCAVAQMMDRGEALSCHIDHISPEDFPWGAVSIAVEVE